MEGFDKFKGKPVRLYPSTIEGVVKDTYNWLMVEKSDGKIAMISFDKIEGIEEI